MSSNEFPYRVAVNRRNVLPPSIAPRRWCPLWENRLRMAAEELNIEYTRNNGGMFFRMEADRDAVLTRGEELWRQGIAHRLAIQGMMPADLIPRSAPRRELR